MQPLIARSCDELVGNGSCGSARSCTGTSHWEFPNRATLPHLYMSPAILHHLPLWWYPHRACIGNPSPVEEASQPWLMPIHQQMVEGWSWHVPQADQPVWHWLLYDCIKDAQEPRPDQTKVHYAIEDSWSGAAGYIRWFNWAGRIAADILQQAGEGGVILSDISLETIVLYINK
jgi:hypothetical protein